MLMWFWSVWCFGVPITLRNYTHTHTRVCTNMDTHPGDKPDIDPCWQKPITNGMLYSKGG